MKYIYPLSSTYVRVMLECEIASIIWILLGSLLLVVSHRPPSDDLELHPASYMNPSILKRNLNAMSTEHLISTPLCPPPP